MIRETLARTKAATFAIELPEPSLKGMPFPTGTGFFVSPDGWFVTAAHVISNPDGERREDISSAHVMKEPVLPHPPPYFGHVACDTIDPVFDFALLKVDYEANAKHPCLKGARGFPHVEVSYRTLQEGEPVYCFGYPLHELPLYHSSNVMTAAVTAVCPRTTSAVVSSTLEMSGPIMSSQEPQRYVLDKALNYGNSGGPVIATATGNVHAFCTRFQPVPIPQNHIRGPDGNPIVIQIPSLYGVVSSLSHPHIVALLKEKDIRVRSD